MDDDPGVLAALEAELSPGLRDLLHFEAFDDPQEVLEALPRWSAESRQIAIALVDQKMPGMSGVELLRRLRPPPVPPEEPEPFHPARYTQKLMLTGYAGLESAIEALNECGACRYLEKPWSATALFRTIRDVLGRWLSAGSHEVHYVMRQVVSRDEVLDLFRLRYAVYAESGLKAAGLRDDGELTEVDSHDSRARQFALFHSGDGSVAMVGGLRVVGQDASPQLRWMNELADSNPQLSTALCQAPAARLPLLEYLPEREVVSALIEHLLARGESVTEPSRLVLKRELRARAVGTHLPLGRHIIESAVAFFFYFRIPHAILTCSKEHRVFYRPYGFTLTEGTSIQLNAKFGFEVACLHGKMASVPDAARARCTALAARIRRTGGACCCESFPDCLGGPYESGDFTSSDVFCPMLAQERVTPPAN